MSQELPPLPPFPQLPSLPPFPPPDRDSFASYTPHSIHSYLPGERFHHLRLERRHYGSGAAANELNIFGNRVSASQPALWEARCDCGRLTLVRTSDLRKSTARGFSCGKCNRKRPRKLHSNTCPPAWRHKDQTFGRLYVSDWIAREGWVCICTVCGQEEIVPRSSMLALMGTRPCRNPPLPADSPDLVNDLPDSERSC